MWTVFKDVLLGVTKRKAELQTTTPPPPPRKVLTVQLGGGVNVAILDADGLEGNIL